MSHFNKDYLSSQIQSFIILWLFLTRFIKFWANDQSEAMPYISVIRRCFKHASVKFARLQICEIRIHEDVS